ncbi:MAG: Calx-beta domain-containing protein [Myxococcota bacterium]
MSYQSCVSPFSNHLADTAHCGRGGSLMIRFADGQVVDLLALADWSAVAGGKPAANTVAVRHPAVSFAADKAAFSMVIGAPTGPADTSAFTWQLYEITLPTQAMLGAAVKPVVTKVANQPAYDNIDPAYAPGGRIVFASARPYNGQPHLTQREEYLGLPTVSGLWILDPSDASSLLLLHHAPSGAFAPTIDSAGRVVFDSWDHLARDSEAVTDSRNGITAAPYNETFVQTFNGAGNFADESAGAAFTQVTAMAPETWDTFPEPRNFDHKTLHDIYGDTLNGNAQNIFLPWTIALDGTGGEILNHVGRHEVAGGVSRSFKNDANVVDLNASVNPGYGGLAPHRFFNNFQAPREDPTTPGRFYGADAPDLGTHGAGQIVRLEQAGVAADGAPQNPDQITVTYITAGANGAAKPGFIPVVKPSIDLPATGQTALTAANAESLYRTPLPCADGTLVASHAAAVTQADYNVGTHAQPLSLFTFRLKSLKPSGSTWVPDVTLTSGVNINASYYVGGTLVSYNGPAWELDPVEVAPRAVPNAAPAAAVDPVEAQVFDAVGVDVATFQSYLRDNDAALSVSRDVTLRDAHDRQQPFNLRVKWSGKTSVATTGKVYDVGWLQFLEADLRRGYLLGGTTPAPGRRAVATPLHDGWDENVQAPGAPPGAVKIADDGSFAAIVPAGKALTWHLLDDDAAKTSQVKERFWVTFQRGEIRTCANCHGINTYDQTGVAGKPTNPPAALTSLLTAWKARYPAGAMALSSAAASALWSDDAVTLTVARTGGNVGPVSVAYATSDGSAHADTDYDATSGRLAWADGDTAPKTIHVPLLGAAFSGPDRTFIVTLSSPQYGSLGTIVMAVVSISGQPDVVEVDADVSDDTTVADDTIAPPDDTVAPPDDTVIAVDDTSTAPEDTSTTPEDTSTTPEDTSTTPEDTSTTADDTSTTADDTSTTPDDTSTTTEVAERRQSSDDSGCGAAPSGELAALLAAVALGLRRRKKPAQG